MSVSTPPLRARRAVPADDRGNLSRREARRLETQEALIEAAMRLLSEKGFEETTVDEIAAAAGISRRTLFRHFPTKADIVTAWTQKMTDILTSHVDEGRPDLCVQDVICAALEAVVPHMAKTRAEALAFVRLIERTPGLRSVSLQKYAQWEESLASVILDHLPLSDDRPLAARVAARSGIAAFRTAVDEWIRVKGRIGLVSILRHVFALQRDCFRS
ncbi:TetR/AcrR family transcriptional regulator [Acetobacter conturbans]|uniref:TetR/AcrR family transcriptional regulator n=1 Tax=Acetobacter conturbans TaxID=1737472 RepID=UPI001F557D61|nr:TetR/AcrR family transcriptional regulator [Acetobacter conturbans]